MKPGEKLYLYTDGITEALNDEEMVYGKERLERFLFHHLNSAIETIIKESFRDVSVFVNGASQSDDITLLVIEYNGQDGHLPG